MLAVLVTASSAHAFSSIQVKCFEAIAKASQGFVKGKLKLLQKCRNANLKDGSCSAPDVDAVGKLVTKLNSTIDKACTLTISNFATMGFPGPCTDANPGDGFTLSDLKTCIQSAHEDIIDQLYALQYDATLTTPLPSSADQKCQAEIAKQGAALAICVLKHVQKCRNDIMKGKLLNVIPDFCATSNPKTQTAITKCGDKLTAGIAGKCSTAQILSLKVCTPDQPDAAGAAACLITEETVRADGPEITVPADMIDYEYAVRGGVCGDGILNNLNEECDGDDDDACPGLCGTALVPDGFFACLCKTKPRMLIAQHANADTDNGWVGISVDGSVVDGSSYLVDLYDCVSGLCNAGPHCSAWPYSPCGVPLEAASGTTSDSICVDLGQGVCRKERTATGPHCFLDINKKCAENNPHDPVCNTAPGDFCATTFFGAPVAQAAGGVAVCNVSTFSEDVVGTVNIVDGSASVRVRQRGVVYNPITQSKPCPVCGDFCLVSRDRCSVDADCAPGMGPCINDAVCSDGARKDKACRRTQPFGGNLPFFGMTSVDCPPNTGLITSNTGGLDINADPRTTGTVSLAPSFPCIDPGFTGNTCLAGTSEGRPCTTASECPGGSCSPQCFCSGQTKPNDCYAACVGGPDGAACIDDSECPGGFCHPADCRVDPLDLDSNQEGICTSGPSESFCSITTYKPCTNASQCAPPTCPNCQTGETCQPRKRACFVNSGIVRSGTPGLTERESAGVYCVPANFAAINASAGFPGPGALIQREHVVVVP
jgi:hypothetical protein